MSIMKEFKEFAMKGNVVDMAVGFILGGAFSTIVKSMVSDIIMPPIGLLLGGVDFAELKLVLNTFEPRLKRDSVKVRVERSAKAGLVIQIEGTLQLSPVPERMRLSTTIDLDNGNARTTLEER